MTYIIIAKIIKLQWKRYKINKKYIRKYVIFFIHNLSLTLFDSNKKSISVTVTKYKIA